MKSHLRFGIAVAVNVGVFVLLVVLGILMKSNAPSRNIEVFFPDPPVAEARIITRIISPQVLPAAQLHDSHVRVSGLIQCTAGQTLLVRATITQQSTGATASGEAEDICTGHVQRWVIHATTSDGAELVSGGAAVHVWSKTPKDGAVHEWDDIVRLVGPHRP